MLKGDINDEDLEPSAEAVFLKTLPVALHADIRRVYAANEQSHKQVGTWDRETPLQHMYAAALDVMDAPEPTTMRFSQRRNRGRGAHINAMEDTIAVADINQQEPCAFCHLKGKPQVKHCKEACFEVGNRKSKIPLEIRIADIDPDVIKFYHTPGNNTDLNKSICIFGNTPTELEAGKKWNRSIQQILQHTNTTLPELIPLCTKPDCPATKSGHIKPHEATQCVTVVALRLLKSKCAKFIWENHDNDATTIGNMNTVMSDAAQCFNTNAYATDTPQYRKECEDACDVLGLSHAHHNRIYGHTE